MKIIPYIILISALALIAVQVKNLLNEVSTKINTALIIPLGDG